MAMNRTLAGKTIFISGGSRGIGLAVALRAAAMAPYCDRGQDVRTTSFAAGTISTAARQIEEAGGQALRSSVISGRRNRSRQRCATIARFGGMTSVSIRQRSAAENHSRHAHQALRSDQWRQRARHLLVTQKCLPHLLMAENPHVLAISPPLNMEERWFAPHVAYSISKFGMSLVMLGVAGEFRGRIAAIPMAANRHRYGAMASSSRISISVRYAHRKSWPMPLI